MDSGTSACQDRERAFFCKFTISHNLYYVKYVVRSAGTHGPGAVPHRCRETARHRSNPLAAIACPCLFAAHVSRYSRICRSGPLGRPGCILLRHGATTVSPSGFQAFVRRGRLSRLVERQGLRYRRAEALVACFVPASTAGAARAARTRKRASAGGPRQASGTSPVAIPRPSTVSARRRERQIPLPGWPERRRPIARNVVRLRRVGREDHGHRLLAPPGRRHLRVHGGRYRGLRCWSRCMCKTPIARRRGQAHGQACRCGRTGRQGLPRRAHTLAGIALNETNSTLQ
jgi:hypothetical protein